MVMAPAALALGLLWSAAADVVLGPRTRNGASLVNIAKLPLHTKGRYIVNVENERVKWACINWAGAYSLPAVVGGLEAQNLTNLAARISNLGFNCVRLCYSTENHLMNPLVKDEDLAANPRLKGKRFMEIFEQTVQALTDQGLMVILNNHISRSGWCCNVLQDEGFWYTERFPEEKWMESLLDMTRRFRNNSLVVAFDLRNEPHDIPGRWMTWGDGNPATDWAYAAERAGNAVLDVNPNLLIVVSALCFCMDLRPVKRHPIKFKLPGRLVYETHNYIEFQIATLFSNNFFSWKEVATLSTYILVALVVLDLAFLYVWRRIGRPWPRKSTLLALISGWASFFFAVVAAVCGFGFHFYLQYCSYVAWYYFLPYTILCAIAALVLFLLGFWAAKFGLRVIATSDDCAMLPEVCEDVCDDDDVPSEGNGLTSSDEECDGVKCRVYQAENGQGVRSAKVRRVPGFSCEPGCQSIWLAQEYCVGPRRRLPPLSQAEAPTWDQGLLLLLHIFMFLFVSTLLTIGLVTFARLADTYWYMRCFMAKLAGKRVVLSGCGGGSDVLGTSVIYAQIKDVAKQVIFFSLTFTSDAILNKTCQKAGPPDGVPLIEDYNEAEHGDDGPGPDELVVQGRLVLQSETGLVPAAQAAQTAAAQRQRMDIAESVKQAVGGTFGLRMEGLTLQPSEANIVEEARDLLQLIPPYNSIPKKFSLSAIVRELLQRFSEASPCGGGALLCNIFILPFSMNGAARGYQLLEPDEDGEH
ncbi:unnamed protein product [Cladocopium goreaui]|uniref:Glycoside hydrolase family 5 domain-containing protein n=1 Tax=Cladocopium goreaui TaxID=2562237 RepID=A0A9P1BIN1_9DINO|nr:unnamed protein product [Cladocopium goreaui]